MVRGDRVDRIAIEGIFDQAAQQLADSGMSEAPTAPAISVIPLALYRVVTKYGSLAELEA